MNKNLLLLVVVFMLSLLTIQAQNLLTNPGFETWVDGTPTGWAITNSGGISQNTDLFKEGVTSCKTNPQSGTFNISQSVDVTPGKTYTFKVSYYIESGDGTDARISSYFKNSSDVAIKMSIEDSLALKGPGGNTAYFPNETGSWITYTCDIVAPANASKFVFLVSTAKFGSVLWDDFSLSINSTPTLYSSKTSLTGLNTTPGSKPSTEQSIYIKGNNLSGSIIVTAPTNFEISVFSGKMFYGASSLTIAQSNGSVSALPIYVRLKSGLAENTYSGNITLSSAGAIPINVTLSGTVAPLPVVLTSSVTSLTGFAYVVGNGPSNQKSFTFTGSGLTSDVIITANDDYEISVLSGSSFSGTNSLTVAQTDGNIAATTVYVRLKSGLNKATYSGNISLSANGGTSQNIVLSGTVTDIPEILTSVTSLNEFNYYLGAGPSAEKSFTVSATGSATFLMLITPIGYEISTETGTGFSGSSQLVIPLDENTPSTEVYVRLMSGLEVSTYTGDILIFSTNYETKTISLNGDVLMATGNAEYAKPSIKVYTSASDIVVQGTLKGEMVSLYSMTGMHLQTVKSEGDRIVMSAQPGGVYLVKTPTKVVKVIL